MIELTVILFWVLVYALLCRRVRSNRPLINRDYRYRKHL